jgi:hypothetical protein
MEIQINERHPAIERKRLHQLQKPHISLRPHIVERSEQVPFPWRSADIRS